MSQALVSNRNRQRSSQLVTGKKAMVTRADPLVERTLSGKYFVVRKIGEGGCGNVYHAIDKETGGDVAVKTMQPHLVRDNEHVARFVTEANLGRWVNHPNVSRVIELSLQTDPIFFVMEYLEGSTIGDYIRRNGPLTWDEVRYVLLPVCEALAAVHRDGFIHRDIKPDNIFLLTDGTVKLLDMGLVIHTEEVCDKQDTCLGTPEYMAPEHIMGERIDQRIDVYSLGATAYQMLTGKLPFGGKVLEQIFQGHLLEVPDVPSFIKNDVPQEADLVVLRALAKDPNHRFQSVTEMKDALLAA